MVPTPVIADLPTLEPQALFQRTWAFSRMLSSSSPSLKGASLTKGMDHIFLGGAGEGRASGAGDGPQGP